LDGRRFHARFTLPDEPEPLELVVRLVHYQASPLDPRNVIAGWAFCSTEDPVQQQRQEIRIERFVAREELARVRRRQPKHKES
jgi:hypothetical protein